MSDQQPVSEYDVIVISSGMGGMASAAALSRFDHKVLLLEQAPMIGGLTHSFSREGFTWDVGCTIAAPSVGSRGQVAFSTG